MGSITARWLHDFDRWPTSSLWPAFAGIYGGSPRNMTKSLPRWRRAQPNSPWHAVVVGDALVIVGLPRAARTCRAHKGPHFGISTSLLFLSCRVKRRAHRGRTTTPPAAPCGCTGSGPLPNQSGPRTNWLSWAQSADPVRGWIASPGFRGPVLGGALQDPQAALATGAAWGGGCCGRSPADRSKGRGVSPAGYDRE
jgi:hypothetical protein